MDHYLAVALAGHAILADRKEVKIDTGRFMGVLNDTTTHKTEERCFRWGVLAK